MKLLSDVRFRPDALYALVRFLASCKDEPTTEDVCVLMAPGYSPGENETRILDLRDAAVGLGFLAPGTWRFIGEAWDLGRETFFDRVHRSIAADEDFFPIYASLVIEIEKSGASWTRSRSDFVGTLRDRVAIARGGKTATFNDPRLLPWRSLAAVLGLGYIGPNEVSVFLAHPVERLQRVALALPELSAGGEMTAVEFLSSVAREMPYLDGGVFFEDAAARAEFRPSGGAVSRILSQALVDLDERKILVLEQRGGDREGARRLATGSTTKERAFAFVKRGEGR